MRTKAANLQPIPFGNAVNFGTNKSISLEIIPICFLLISGKAYYLSFNH
jgi:hypothetical protein